ncbi:HlyD family efflux transporter periplasmic adaptor subunit [Steroidobacter flavus]|uniref:HlyD family efflux transporter periplasmic adaptor subunit n=1 Tax=Steroidobacter flavus TaxID=1842136 RepID=A0ABV8T2B7_9GAMM
MGTVYYRSKKGLNRFLEDHGPEGVAIVTDQPSRLIRGTILVFFGLLIAAVLWSFIGKSDVVVESTGMVKPELEQQGVYLPIKGELVNVYVTEGMPIQKGDVVARIDSPNAIELAGQATQASVHLAAAERGYEMFPTKKKAMEKEIAALKDKIAADERDNDWRVAESVKKLAEEQQLKLEKARAKLAKAGAERDQAQRVLEQHERLFNSPGNGGLSRDQVEEKRGFLREKTLDYKLAESELGEFEVSLMQEYDKKKQDLQKKSQDLLAAQAQYENMLLRLTQDEEQAETDLRLARAKSKAASRISYEDIDEDNFLRIRAPMDGVVTTVTFTDVGAQVDEKTPVVLIAPKGARKVLEIEINERDRAFLKPGMPVRIKVNAFPYQRYGVLTGELEHISPASSPNRDTKQIVYKARVGLQSDHFTVNNVATPIRYGMAAKVEIVVESRRLIDLAIDPFRNSVG